MTASTVPTPPPVIAPRAGELEMDVNDVTSGPNSRLPSKWSNGVGDSVMASCVDVGPLFTLSDSVTPS